MNRFALIAAIPVMLLAGACGNPAAPAADEAPPDSGRATFDRLLSDSKIDLGSEATGREGEVYACFLERIKSEQMDPAHLLGRLDQYYGYLDMNSTPPPAERPQLEGAVLFAQEQIRRCRPTPLRSPSDLAAPAQPRPQ